MDHVGSHLLLVLNSFFLFGIALGRPPAAILSICGSFHGPFGDHVAHCFADAAKRKICTLLHGFLAFEMLGLLFRIICLTLRFFMLLSRQHLCLIYVDFEPQRASCSGQFSEIFQTLHEQNVLPLRLEK